MKEEQYGYVPEYFWPNTQIISEITYIIRWHRLDGPAHIVYNKKGVVAQYKWWVHGVVVTGNILDKYFVDTLHPTPEEIFIFKIANA